MATEYIDYKPIGGINQEDPEIALREEEVRDARNFLFERGIALTRPGLTSYTTASAGVKLVRSFNFNTVKTIAVIGNQIFSLDPVTLAATQITNGLQQLSFGNAEHVSVDVVNGVVLIGGQTGGIVRWDPAGTTFSVVNTVGYRYVTGQISRAVAAYDVGGSALLGPRTVGWSRAGDETNWTGTFQAGTVTLADANDDITGIGNLRGTIVVARTGGFHLGHATGNSNPAFSWELHSKFAIGCKYPSTWTVYGTQAFFVGEEDVHTFNLVAVEDIGRPIRRELLGYLRLGILYRGFVSQGIGLNARDHYHLCPMTATEGLPHFLYDLEERKWSKHVYDGYLPVTGWYQKLAGNASAPALMDASGAIRVWDEAVACEAESKLYSKKFIIGRPEQDFQSQRGLMVYRAPADIENLEVVVTANVDTSVKSGVMGVALKGDNFWRRAFMNHRIPGNLFTYDLTVPAGNALEINYLGFNMGKSGEMKNA